LAYSGLEKVMVDPSINSENAGRTLRDLENARSWEPVKVEVAGFDGLREYSEAWHENRSTAYLLRKSWADPVARWATVLVLSIIASVWLYLLSQ
jgi:hypothetical protein